MTRPVFVFGSNLAGRHGKGAALHAAKVHGAERGVGEGRTGNAYAIPTKDASLKTLPLERIAMNVETFAAYARRNPETLFELTPIGTGLAAHSRRDVFRILQKSKLSSNVLLSASWTWPARVVS